jgi:hypothetical protein
VTGGVAVWAATWDFSRDGVQAPMFSPWTTVAVALFFVVPFLHLLFSPVATRPDTEPVASANAGRSSRLQSDASGPAWLRSSFVGHGGWIGWRILFTNGGGGH